MESNRYLDETKLLDYSNQKIQDLIKIRKWENREEEQQIKAIYNYVRDEIMFGYNVDDNYKNLGRHLMNNNVRKIRNSN
ncbi:hypothetical protein [Acetobacterium sp.]|uniref:hypothetical protein n=1 Tax=Acetobacterium sp. TaxID=1872094 RepID=UPI00271A43E8|nr:hypothetical protein [Acetobacterium sp.]MDO9490869.1 hypothetical protein [Acetobacterium sp.]